MNREDIIRMAREVADIETDYRGREEFIFDSYGIERFANLVAATEREACAALCDKISDEDGFEGSYANRCAFAIRERGAP
jgi:hypothetical protein